MKMLQLTENEAVDVAAISEMTSDDRSKSVGTARKRNIFAYEFCKAITDRIMALFGILFLSPFMILIAIGIRIDSPGNAIYRREQVGKLGKKFIAYKFRTMKRNNDDREYKTYLVKYILENRPYQVDENGKEVFKVVNDPRVTRFGAILRKSNLDELPQLFNILKGEMSWVGPRPDIPYSVNMYKDWHRQRLEVIPGMTGLWQVSGRKNVSFEEMVRLDVEYINNRSLLLDTKIILSTVNTVLRGDGS
jgi:lipopolysaccharide/colanic/teichoic acid biosynthesis glycosyltransferase